MIGRSKHTELTHRGPIVLCWASLMVLGGPFNETLWAWHECAHCHRPWSYERCRP